MTDLALQTIRRRAQAAANREGAPMAILNLNTYSPMYVIRSASDGIEAARGFVELVKPEPAPLIVEICPLEPRASVCLANGESALGSEHEADLLDCTASGDCEPACAYVRDHIGVDFRIVARNAAGEYENRIATAEEKAATCRAIYFESETDFTDEATADLYLIWQAAADLEHETA